MLSRTLDTEDERFTEQQMVTRITATGPENIQ